MFRSPGAVIVWWVWVVLAVASLVDLAVQGSGYGTVIAVVSVLFITSLVYVAALRPRLLIEDDGLTVVNPVREHRVPWAAVADAEALELLRVRYLVTRKAAPGTEVPGTGKDSGEPARRSLWVWGVQSSRRKQIAADLRAERRAAGGSGRGGFGAFRGGGGIGGGLGGGGLGSAQRGAFSWSGGAGAQAPEPDALKLDVAAIVATITARSAQARQDAGAGTAPPAVASSWNWAAIALMVVPGLALLAVALA